MFPELAHRGALNDVVAVVVNHAYNVKKQKLPSRTLKYRAVSYCYSALGLL